ncbi:hypothetical protein CAOG_04324 [Capsaspora owczarzaki ATCC 30864]|uniref:Choline/carnitine acyltransferase domain-containing protein n=1 Tax=Capsaspora owczarzaki (strain ATCC 30864) TaxID=595528 RepID=A0A0D2WPX4_CAPO3|nr:hypothetical protein CAOG_04324 [Capsaspora owczarzaki ATCC 30864]KJE93555.1 hypothetical protein CAOG_004324 [Capsaspora owczarzaki ATCC 30864]|eukprot:XP_004348152.1 hypothetical protein CAOG_04324 [Capsaspora owczarzaki ATCC 30864]
MSRSQASAPVSAVAAAAAAAPRLSTPVSIVIAVLVTLLALALYSPPVASLVIGLLFNIVGAVAIVLYTIKRVRWLRIRVLRLLLSHTGWAYNPSALTSQILLGLVGLFGGNKPRLWELQSTLPALPVPPLHQTVDKYLKSVRPLLNDQEYATTKKLADDFIRIGGDGERLQNMLLAHRDAEVAKGTSWLWTWWEQIVYLSGRDPLPIYSNWYGLDRIDPVLTSQVGRAANAIVALLKFKRMIDTQSLAPNRVQETVPLCMHQYSRIFGTVRIPEDPVDRLVVHSKSKHIVVMCNNAIYRVDVFHDEGHGVAQLSAHELRVQLGRIIDLQTQSSSVPSDSSEPVAILTSQNRSVWAKQRQELIAMDKINKESIEVIESALFVVVLDTNEPAPETVEELSYEGLHHHGRGYWFDKNLNIIFFKNGRHSMNVDHTWSDASVMVHVMDFVYSVESTADHWTPDVTDVADNALAPPTRLHWHLTPLMRATIAEAHSDYMKTVVPMIDLEVLKFQVFGKDVIKKIGVSPDAFVQMAIQLAFFRMHNEPCLTYESAATVRFNHGRTETVRSCSIESKRFVDAMQASGVSSEKKLELLRAACKSHVKFMRAATNGDGIDRHLLGLRILARGAGIDSPFLADKAMSLPFRLSTSQTPALRMLGGGFAPLVANGYGCSYIVDDFRIWAHLSCFAANPETDVKKFSQLLRSSLLDIYEVCRSDPNLEKLLSTRTYRMLRSQ